MSNLADDFCIWYDRLDEARLVNDGVRWRREDADRAWEVRTAIGAGESIDWPADSDGDAGQRQLYATLRGIDLAFMWLHPDFMGRRVPAALAEPRECLRRHGRLTSDTANGALVLKLSSADPETERPQHPDQAFEYVQRATREQCEHVERVLPRDGLTITPSEKHDGIVVGCVAFLDHEGELDVSVVPRDGLQHYRIRVRDDKDWPRERIDELIEIFDSSGVALGVLPEMALTEGLLHHWQDRLGTRHIPPDSRLRWVLVGSGNANGNEPPLNTAVLLDGGTGERVVEQSKQYRFDIKVDNQKASYAFKAFPKPPTETLHEDIYVSRTLRVLELGSVRLAILICEDVANLSALLPKVHHNGVSHVLNPVFAKHTRYWLWEQQAAEAFARAQGTVVVVANSFVVPRMNSLATPIPATLTHTPWGWALQQADGPCAQMRTIIRPGKKPEPLDDVAPGDPAGP